MALLALHRGLHDLPTAPLQYFVKQYQPLAAQTIWPRMGAIAERLWSARDVVDTVAAKPRYAAFRCLLNRRGIAAAPAFNAHARTAPPGPGGCYDQ